VSGSVYCENIKNTTLYIEHRNKVGIDMIATIRMARRPFRMAKCAINYKDLDNFSNTKCVLFDICIALVVVLCPRMKRRV
jgi:hypothetical protein